MDLNDVVSSVYADSAEAHAAFHAGHHDKAENYLVEIVNTAGEYLVEKGDPRLNVIRATTRETPDEVPIEKPAEVPGAPAQPVAVDPVAPASEVLPASPFQTPPQ